MFKLRSRRRLMPAAGALFTVLLTAVSTSPAAAARGNQTTPKVPFVVDGVRYAPKQIHRFDGRPLFFAVDKDRGRMIGFTKRGEYSAYLQKTAGLRFKPGTLEPAPTAHSSTAGHRAWYYAGYEPLLGAFPSFEVASGWAVGDLKAQSFYCGYESSSGECRGTYDNAIEWVFASGRGTILFDGYSFDYNTGSIYIPGNNVFYRLADYGWADRASSLLVGWCPC